MKCLARSASILAGAFSAAKMPTGLEFEDALRAEDRHAQLRRQLARAVARICPRWLAAQADDIVQAGMLRVMDILRESEGKATLNASYLWRVAYSATVDEIRRLRRRREVPLDEVSPEVLPDASDPERSQAGSEIAQGLQDCLGRLVEGRRLAVALHLQGHSVPEVARLLGWGAKKVENLVYRGLADLRRCLVAKGLKP